MESSQVNTHVTAHFQAQFQTNMMASQLFSLSLFFLYEVQIIGFHVPDRPNYFFFARRKVRGFQLPMCITAGSFTGKWIKPDI